MGGDFVYFGPKCKVTFCLSANCLEFERRVLEHRIYRPSKTGTVRSIETSQHDQPLTSSLIPEAVPLENITITLVYFFNIYRHNPSAVTWAHISFTENLN
jgi:hypothetical protein